MNRVNVLLMIGSMDGGGSERQTLLLLQHLDRDRFNIHLYVKRAEGSLMRRVPNDVHLHVATDFAFQNAIYWPGRIASQEAHQLQQLITEHDIHVIYDRTYHMSLIAAPACVSLSQLGKMVPRISTIVSPPSHAVPSVETRFVEWKRRRLARAYQQSTQVIAVSDIAATDASQYYQLPREKFTVIRNPVDTEAIVKSSQVCNPAWQPDRERLNVICVGRMTAEKGHSVLLDALHRLRGTWPVGTPTIHLGLIGDGPLRSELTKKAEDYQFLGDQPVSHKVSFLGRVDEPAASIAAADALVLPSLFEGLPNVVLEAMALGRPVIATRAGGTPEIEHDSPVAFWAQPGDVESLAAALRSFCTKRDQANAHVVNASRVLANHHSLVDTIRTIESLLESV